MWPAAPNPAPAPPNPGGRGMHEHFARRLRTVCRTVVARPAAAAILTLAALAAPVDAAAQQVRVVADGTEVRLDPKASSPVITRMEAGALLERVGESGDWYAVSIVGVAGQDDVIGYVLASQVELVGAGDPPPDLDLADGGEPPLPGIPSLEEQYEGQRRLRSSGVGKVIWGLALVGGSHAALDIVPWLQAPVQEDYDDPDGYQSALDRRSAAETGRTVATAAGAALATWGVGQIAFGWRRMRSLELELPRTAEPSLPRQYGDAFRMRSSGKRKLFWAVAISFLGYGTVEWIPYFGEPDRKDFDDEEDYGDAVKRRDRAETGRSWAMGVGGVLGAWGGTQWGLGAYRMSRIEATARMGATALAAPLRAGTAPARLELFAGRVGARTQVGVRWKW